MKPEPPPRDPNEDPDPERLPVNRFEEPTAVFMRGDPGPEAHRLADAVLDFRPGLLFVVTAA